MESGGRRGSPHQLVATTPHLSALLAHTRAAVEAGAGATGAGAYLMAGVRRAAAGADRAGIGEVARAGAARGQRQRAAGCKTTLFGGERAATQGCIHRLNDQRGAQQVTTTSGGRVDREAAARGYRFGLLASSAMVWVGPPSLLQALISPIRDSVNAPSGAEISKSCSSTRIVIPQPAKRLISWEAFIAVQATLQEMAGQRAVQLVTAR